MLSTIYLLVLTVEICAGKTDLLFHRPQFLDGAETDVVLAPREKRTISNFAEIGIQTLKKLLTGTTPAYSAGNKFRNHEKLGDLDTALRDFYSVQPIKVTSTINSQGVKVIKGKSGNRALSLQTNSFKGYPILDIIDYNSKHKGGRYVDRILYKTGDMKKYQRNPENKAE